jgi:hypothetical protein
VPHPIAFVLAIGWDNTKAKEQIHPARDLVGLDLIPYPTMWPYIHHSDNNFRRIPSALSPILRKSQRLPDFHLKLRYFHTKMIRASNSGSNRM